MGKQYFEQRVTFQTLELRSQLRYLNLQRYQKSLNKTMTDDGGGGEPQNPDLFFFLDIIVLEIVESVRSDVCFS